MLLISLYFPQLRSLKTFSVFCFRLHQLLQLEPPLVPSQCLRSGSIPQLLAHLPFWCTPAKIQGSCTVRLLQNYSVNKKTVVYFIFLTPKIWIYSLTLSIWIGPSWRTCKSEGTNTMLLFELWLAVFTFLLGQLWLLTAGKVPLPSNWRKIKRWPAGTASYTHTCYRGRDHFF